MSERFHGPYDDGYRSATQKNQAELTALRTQLAAAEAEVELWKQRWGEAANDMETMGIASVHWEERCKAVEAERDIAKALSGAATGAILGYCEDDCVDESECDDCPLNIQKALDECDANLAATIPEETQPIASVYHPRQNRLYAADATPEGER